MEFVATGKDPEVVVRDIILATDAAGSVCRTTAGQQSFDQLRFFLHVPHVYLQF